MEEIQHSLLFCMDPYGNGIIPYNAHMKKTVQDLFHQPLVDSPLIFFACGEGTLWPVYSMIPQNQSELFIRNNHIG